MIKASIIIPYIPIIFAIYLIWISNISSGYLRSKVTAYINKQSKPIINPEIQKFIESSNYEMPNFTNIERILLYFSMGWSVVLGFINTAFAAIVSLLTIFASKSNSVDIGVLTIVATLAIFIPMFWWIFSMDILDIVTVNKKILIKTTPANFCKIILTVFNIFLAFAIFKSQ